ncbi:MAG: hypothetical protein AAFV53_09030, partial [Myxococcota bacterium]
RVRLSDHLIEVFQVRIGLDEMVAEADAPLSAQRVRGIADVGPTGAIRFFVESDGRAFLESLADLVAAQLDEIPDLRRLAGAQVVEQADGGPVTIHESDALWSGLLSQSLPASAAVQRFGVADALAEIEEQSELMFWLGTEGPGAVPTLTVVREPRRDGPDRLKRRIRALRMAGAGGETARGIVRLDVNDAGRKRLVFASLDECPKLLAALGRWTQAHLPDAPVLKRLRNAGTATLDQQGQMGTVVSDRKMWRQIFSA